MTLTKKRRKALLLSLLLLSCGAVVEDQQQQQGHVDFQQEGYMVLLPKHRRREMWMQLFLGYTAGEFRQKYRVTRTVFRGLVRLIGTRIRHGNSNIVPEMMLALWLSHCAHADTHRTFCSDCGLGRRQVSVILNKVTEALCDVGIAWPTKCEQMASAAAFSEMQPLIRNAIGSVDGTHVKVNENQDSKHYYINRKGWPSTSVMGVCDAFMKFIFIGLDAPGSVHDSRVFRCSNLPDVLQDPALTLPSAYLLGDAAYGNGRHLLAPSNTVETVAEERFNFVHSSCRTIIERTFGVFKGMWKILDAGRHNCQRTSKLFKACAVVHNLIIDSKMDISEWMGHVDEGVFCNDHAEYCPPTMDDQAAGKAIQEHIIDMCGNFPNQINSKAMRK